MYMSLSTKCLMYGNVYDILIIMLYYVSCFMNESIQRMMSRMAIGNECFYDCCTCTYTIFIVLFQNVFTC